MTENSKTSNLAETVDSVTRERAAHLSARGILDHQIADILLLSMDQMIAVRETEEFKKVYFAEAERQIQEQIDRDEGWDGVETLALETLFSTMKYNRDPKFALMAAKIANSAERRARSKSSAKVIGEGQPGAGASNVIVINLNKNYIKRDNNENTIDVTARPSQIPLKQSDVPAPKLVDKILAPAKERAQLTVKDRDMQDLQELFKASGVVFDADE